MADEPRLLPLAKPPNGAAFIIVGLTQAPRTHTRPDGQVTPRQPTSVHTPDTHAWPIAHGVTPQDSGWHAPATQVRPMGHETPTHGRSTQVVMATQTCEALQVLSAHVGGKHWPLRHTAAPVQFTPAQATSRHAPLRHTAPGGQVTAPQSRVWHRPSTQVSFAAQVMPTHERCWQTVAFAQTWSTPQLAAEQLRGRHWPPAQPSLVAHRLPQVPQFASSTFTSTQVPLQSVAPVPHATGPPPSALTGGAGQPASATTKTTARALLERAPSPLHRRACLCTK
jgi:hypothetical protein